MPSPNPQETRDEFIQRCMGDGEANRDFPERDQRFAFCNSQWERRMKSQVSKIDSRTGSILLFDDIGTGVGEMSAKQFIDELEALGDVDLLRVNIASQGGSVMEGVAIYNALRKHGAKVRTVIESGALSMASYIFLAGDEREIPANGFIMLHPPQTEAVGDDVDMEKTAQMLKTIRSAMVETYADRTGQTIEQIEALMADGGSWLSAQQALDLGFATIIGKESKLVAAVKFPEVTMTTEPKKEPDKEPKVNTEPQAATLEEIKAICDDPAFVVEQLEAKATATTVLANYTLKLKSENESLSNKLSEKDTELAEAKKTVTVEAKLPKPGAPIVAGGNAEIDGDATQQWDDEFAKALKDCNGNRSQALSMANRRNPGLRIEMLKSVNSEAKRHRAVAQLQELSE